MYKGQLHKCTILRIYIYCNTLNLIYIFFDELT